MKDFGDRFVSVTIKSDGDIWDEYGRSSGNYSLERLRPGSHMMWSAPECVSFDIMQYNEYGNDTCLASNIHNGDVTEYFENEQIYIANPEFGYNIKDSFLIRVDSIGFTDNSSWLGELFKEKGNIKITEINIPGTHDSGAIRWLKHLPSFWSCQAAPIITQLRAGVRLLDIRLKVKRSYTTPYEFIICHGNIGPNEFGPLTDVLQDCKNFLMENPYEFIIMFLKIDDWTNITEYAEKQIAMKNLYELLEGLKEMSLPFSNYNYCEARGKIIYINRIGDCYDELARLLGAEWKWEDNAIFNMRYSDARANTEIVIQDRYEDVYTNQKMEYIFKTLMIPGKDLHVNFCSGYYKFAGLLPYKIDVLKYFLEYIGQRVITGKNIRCFNMGWFLFDFALKELKISDGSSLSAIDAVIDTNYSVHKHYGFHVVDWEL